MLALAFLRQRSSFCGAFNQTLISSQFPPPFTLSTFSVRTSKDQTPKEEFVMTLSWRIEKLPRGEPVGSAFQSWMGECSPVHRGDILHTFNRLRRLKMTKRALEVMEWVIRERPYRPKE